MEVVIMMLLVKPIEGNGDRYELHYDSRRWYHVTLFRGVKYSLKLEDNSYCLMK